MIDFKPNHRVRNHFVLGCLAMAWSSAGCLASQTEDLQEDSPEPMASRSVLDPEMLATALDEQRSFEAVGVNLKTRAWLRPDAYAADYQSAEGAFMGTQRIGTKSLLARVDLPMREDGETFFDFEQRANAVDSMHVAELATDLIWFLPDQEQLEQVEPPDGVAVTRSALTDLEQIAQALANCDAMAKRSCLTDPVGYEVQGVSGPARLFDWTVPFGSEEIQMHGSTGSATISRTPGGAAVASGRGSAAFTGICTRGVSSTFSLNVSQPRFDLHLQSSFGTTVPPLNFFGFVLGEGYKYVDCGPFNATCRYRYDFNQANMNIRYTEGGNLHTFCGQITDHKSVNLGAGCDRLFGTHCATFKMPTNFTVQSVSR